MTNNINNTAPVVSTQRSKEENEIKEKEFRRKMIELEGEYQKKLAQGKKIYEMLGEGVVSYYQALPSCTKSVKLLFFFSTKPLILIHVVLQCLAAFII